MLGPRACPLLAPWDMKRPPRATYRALVRGPGWEGHMVNRPVSLNPNKPWGGFDCHLWNPGTFIEIK